MGVMCSIIIRGGPTRARDNFVLTDVTYPGGEHAVYSYVTADPTDSLARPLLSIATDPAYRLGRPGARMKYVYNYNASYPGSFGLVTGTILEERSNVTDQTIVRFPLGSGKYPQILLGDGTEITRKYNDNGLLVFKGDGEGRMTQFTRDTNGGGFIASKTDANGLTQYSRNAVGRVLNRIDTLGHHRSHTYNDHGFMLSKTDELGHTITWIRDSNNRRTEKHYPDGSYKTWTNYFTNSQPVNHRRRSGGTDSYIYDPVSGDMTSHTGPLQHTTNYTYLSSGLCVPMTDANLHTTTYTYNWRGQVLTTIHSSTNVTFPGMTYEYDNFGNRTAVIDELGHTTHYEYDEYNRLKSVTYPPNRKTEYEYGRTPTCSTCSYLKTVSKVTSPGD